VIAQVLYTFKFVSVMNANQDQFNTAFSTHIYFLNFFRFSIIAFGIFTEVIAPMFEIKGKWDAFLEWYAFNMMFLFYMCVINIFLYKDDFVFENQ
jgi:hypothetical protein